MAFARENIFSPRDHKTITVALALCSFSANKGTKLAFNPVVALIDFYNAVIASLLLNILSLLLVQWVDRRQNVVWFLAFS